MIAGRFYGQRKVRTPQGRVVRNANRERFRESATENIPPHVGKGEKAR